MKRQNCVASRFAVFSNLLYTPLSYIQMSSFANNFQTTKQPNNLYLLCGERNLHAGTKQGVKL